MQIPLSVEQETRLKITEIFYSLQGEADSSGWPTVFIRLTGCPLRCQYCDTAYAFTGGEWMTIADILQTLKQYTVQHVTVTGGEPLAQKDCLLLLQQLCDRDYRVSLETSGAFSVTNVDSRVIKIIDIKTPGSGEQARNDFSNFNSLQPQDQLKFVICNREDFDWSVAFINEHRLTEKSTVLFSPSYQQQNETELADWILQAQLPVRYQIQLHKLLWGDKPGV